MDIYSGGTLLASSLLILAAVIVGCQRIIPLCDELARYRVGALSTQAKSLLLSTAQLEMWLRIWCAALLGLPILVAAYDMKLLSLLVVGLVYVAPEHIMRYLIHRRRTILRDQLVPAIQGLANAAQAGLTLHQGLVEISRDTPKPLSNEINRILADFQRGRPLSEAIEEVRQRLSLESFTLFATAVQTSLERGGRINEALLRIGNSLRENQRVERKMEADTSSGRREVLILSVFPLLFGLMLYTMSPDNTEKLITTVAGQFVVVVVSCLVYFGARWALKMMDVQN